jgi:glycosyltransferase involved in cell wall biosynthesis
MHALIIPSWYPAEPGDIGGSFFREQALALRKSGCKVGVIYPQLRSLRDWRSILVGKSGPEFEDDEGVATFRWHGTNWFPRMPSASRRAWIRLGLVLFKKYVEHHGTPDVIHAHSILNGGVLASEIRKKHDVPYVITEHSTAFARNLISPSDIEVARRASGSASMRFAVSPEFSTLLNRKLSDVNGGWDVMPNIVKQEFLEFPLPSRKTAKEFTFSNVALMDDKKRQKNIVLAFSMAFKERRDVRLIIGGDGPEMHALVKLAANCGTSDQVSFPGILSRDQVTEKVAAADAFVLASRYETFGVVVIEALALGKPVVATRCGGPESIVREEDGLLVPVDDVPSLAAAMQHIYQYRHTYDEKKIRASCGERFGESAIAERLIQVYGEASALA